MFWCTLYREVTGVRGREDGDNTICDMMCLWPGLEVVSGGIHVADHVTNVTDDGSKDENANEKRHTGEDVFLCDKTNC